MSQLILQPSGSEDSQNHFENTMLNPVQIELVANYVGSEELDRLKQLHPGGKIHIWGVTPGSNTAKWERIERGDVAVFAGGGRIFSSARVTHKLRNKKLAEILWGNDAEGRTWEHIYFLEDVTEQNIPYTEFNECVGYKPNAIIQGFNVLPWSKSSNFINRYSLRPSPSIPPPPQPAPTVDGPPTVGGVPATGTSSCSFDQANFPEDDYESIIRDLDENKPLDGTALVQIRKEQAFLRDYLFKNKRVAFCGICGKEYPIDMLVAAHIKKRADCSDDEKRDFKNNVMPACKMGCDDLYEKGYISISSGKVTKCDDRYLTQSLKSYIGIIHKASCLYVSKTNQKYFSWHYENTFRK